MFIGPSPALIDDLLDEGAVRTKARNIGLSGGTSRHQVSCALLAQCALDAAQACLVPQPWIRLASHIGREADCLAHAIHQLDLAGDADYGVWTEAKVSH